MTVGDVGTFQITNDDRFTSDPHWGHSNVIKYCSRPFCCKHQMGEVLIQKWNQAVKPHQRVFVLGDVFFGSKAYMKRIMSRLNGYKIVIKGNHDAGRNSLCEIGFDEAYLSAEATYTDKDGKGLRILMRHVPDRVGAASYDLHLCGHVHEKWARSGNMVNVGMDIWDYEPKPLRFILEHSNARQRAMPVQQTADESWEARNDQLIAYMYDRKPMVPAVGGALPVDPVVDEISQAGTSAVSTEDPVRGNPQEDETGTRPV
jgi:calcineurin-like phosphoesterase family protein